MTEPSITASGLRKLAAAAKTIGATRYAEAYTLVANHMEKLSEECECEVEYPGPEPEKGKG